MIGVTSKVLSKINNLWCRYTSIFTEQDCKIIAMCGASWMVVIAPVHGGVISNTTVQCRRKNFQFFKPQCNNMTPIENQKRL